MSEPAGGRDVRLAAAARMLVGAATREAQRRLRDRGLENITPIDTLILAQLLVRGDSRATQIADRLGVSKQAVQRPLRRLHASGYTEHAADPADRRAQLVRLTASGRRAARAALEVAEEIDRGWEETIEPERIAACKSVLLALAAEVDSGA